MISTFTKFTKFYMILFTLLTKMKRWKKFILQLYRNPSYLEAVSDHIYLTKDEIKLK